MVSEDGKYMAISYTVFPETNNGDTPRIMDCLKIINLSNDKIAYEECGNTDPYKFENITYQFYPKRGVGDLLFIGKYDKKVVWYFLETEKGFLYSLDFPTDNPHDCRIDNKGIEFLYKSQPSRFFEFEKDFKINKLIER